MVCDKEQASSRGFAIVMAWQPLFSTAGGLLAVDSRLDQLRSQGTQPLPE